MVVRPKHAGPVILTSLIILLLFSNLLSVTSSVPTESPPETLDFRGFLEQLNLTQIQDYLKFFSEQSSRFTGSPGYFASASYIRDRFIMCGLQNVTSGYYHKFPVTVPIYDGASFQIPTFPDESFRIYALEPNMVVPVTTPEIVGPILYVGDGTLNNFSKLNRTVEGSIVLMNFNTLNNWLNAAKLGAKAVIFIEPETTTYQECRAKSLDVPFNYPRFYMPLESATRLINILERSQNPVEVCLTANTTWDTVEGINVLGLVKGTVYPDQIIILSAHYDSDSVAPALAPGANQAVGVAVLLEVARVMAKNPPAYSILFVAFSGYNQGLAGSRYFVDDFFFGGVNGDKTGLVTNVGKKVILQVDLQLSTKSDEALRTIVGDFMVTRVGRYAASTSVFGDLNNYVSYLVEEMKYQTGMQYKLGSDMGATDATVNLHLFNQFFPLGAFPTDFEPYLESLGAGFSLLTVDQRDYRLSPLDTYERLNIKNLNIHAEFSAGIIYGLASTENLKGKYLGAFGTLNRLTNRISGQVATYQKDIAWYKGVPRALVYTVGIGGQNTRGFVVQADDDGRFVIVGWGAGTASGSPFLLTAFKLNETTGNIVYAPDLGIHKWASVALNIQQDRDIGFVTVFECASAVAFDLMYPPTLGTEGVTCGIKVLDHETHTSPESYGSLMITNNPTGISVAVAFVEPNKPVEFLLTAVHLGRIPMGFLVNSTDQNLEGYGYEFKAGEQYTFHNTPLKVAEDMFRLNSLYASTLGEYGIAGNLTKMNDEVGRLTHEAEEALANSRYDDAYAVSITAWKSAMDAYAGLRGTTEDTSDTLLFFGLTIIPFAILFESFFIGSSGRRKIFTTVFISVVFLVVFSMLHPAFQLAADPTMVMIGFASLILSAPIIAILFSGFYKFIKKLSVKVSGLHFAELSRVAALILAFSVGIENMKKRRLRAGMTLITVILIVFGLVLFTSVSALQEHKAISIGRKPPYQGIYIRPSGWGVSIGRNIVDVLKARFSDMATMVPRAWLYNIEPGDQGRTVLFTLECNGNRTRYYAVMGLTPEEKKIGWVDIALKEGRWFIPADVEACVLDYSQAKDLGANVGDKVSTLGMELTIVGIVDPQYANTQLKDLDGEQITPWDPRVPVQNFVHISIGECIIVPYDLLMRFAPSAWAGGATTGGLAQAQKVAGVTEGFAIASLTILTADEVTSRSIAEWIFNNFSELYMYVGAGNDTVVYTKNIVYTIFGWQMQMVPMIICSLIVLNIMLASVEERSREISTYATVGMSPLHVSFLFLAEASVYGLVGSIIGFISALSLMRLTSLKYPGMVALNYSSGWVIAPVGLAMLLTALSTIFAMMKASKLVTPSLERTWRIPTKPFKDEWTVPLPFIISEEEASGVMAYLKEYIQTHSGEAEVFSVTSLSYLDNESGKILSMDTRLAPYERGITQKVQIVCTKDQETGRLSISLFIRRESGARDIWERMNRQFIDTTRKQLLLWRTLSPEERRKYEER